MSLAALKLFLLSRIFLSSSGLFVLLLLAISFNWFDAYHITKDGLKAAIEYVDILREWGEKTEHTTEKVKDAYEKAQKDLQGR
jgi:DNA integrity scanning protein DisA with diadenylate cyclase activity